MKKHAKVHTSGGNEFRPGPVQTCYAATRRKWFGVVIPERVDEGVRLLLSAFEKRQAEMESETSPYEIPEKHRNGFHRQYRWDDILRQYEKRSLVVLAQVQQSTNVLWEKRIRSFTQEYFGETNSLIGKEGMHTVVSEMLSVKVDAKG